MPTTPAHTIAPGGLKDADRDGSLLVTVAAGNGASSGRTGRLLGLEQLDVDVDGAVLTVDIGVVELDGIPRRFRTSDLTAAR